MINKNDNIHKGIEKIALRRGVKELIENTPQLKKYFHPTGPKGGRLDRHPEQALSLDGDLASLVALGKITKQQSLSVKNAIMGRVIGKDVGRLRRETGARVTLKRPTEVPRLGPGRSKTTEGHIALRKSRISFPRNKATGRLRTGSPELKTQNIKLDRPAIVQRGIRQSSAVLPIIRGKNISVWNPRPTNPKTLEAERAAMGMERLVSGVPADQRDFIGRQLPSHILSEFGSVAKTRKEVARKKQVRNLLSDALSSKGSTND
jgi:hypothetical protein